jgi:3-hydroxyacyl-[acyl-carrier-protein] dehydratase
MEYLKHPISYYFPHRHPFLLIDRVEYIGDNRAVAIKTVTRTEPWFTGHFPDQSVLPGVILLEAMAQTGRFLNSLDEKMISTRLARIDSVKFLHEAVPGDVIHMEAQRIGELGHISKFHVTATINEEICASADFYVHTVMESMVKPYTESSIEVMDK